MGFLRIEAVRFPPDACPVLELRSFSVPGGVRSRSQLERLCIRNLLGQSEERVFFKDLASRFVLVSEGFVSALAGGRSTDEVVGLTDFDIFSSPHATAAFEDEQRIIQTGEPMAAKLERETFVAGPDRWVSTVKRPLRDDDGNIVGTWGISRDVTAQVEAEEALAYQSLHDSLTGLPNRMLLIDRAERMLAQARRPGRRWRRCTSIWMGSSRSTTRSAMPQAMSCCAASQSG